MDIQSYKKKIFSTYNVLSLSIILVIYFFDRITKVKIIEHQKNNNAIFLNDYLNLELIWNTGIGFGLLSSTADMFYHFITFFIVNCSVSSLQTLDGFSWQHFDYTYCRFDLLV